MFGCNRGEMTENWVEYNDEELYDYLLFTNQYSGNKSEESKIIRPFGTCREEEKALERSGGET
jgi:hypothetical protein